MKLTKEELAKALNGIEYRQDIPDHIQKNATDSSLVIIYGASDDLMELEGAIYDEGSCYRGADFLIDQKGLLPDRDDIEEDDELEEYFKRKKQAAKIKACWCKKGEPAWSYYTSIPHVTFDVMEGDEVQCRGIIFNIINLPS